MKKWLALPVIALLALLGWLAAGPFMTVNAIREAIRAEDTAALSEHVDFPVLRQSLRAQVEDYVARRAGPDMQDNPWAAIALGLANSAIGGTVDALATTAGIGAVLQGRGLLHRISGSGIDRMTALPTPRRRTRCATRDTASIRLRVSPPPCTTAMAIRWCSCCIAEVFVGSSTISGCLVDHAEPAGLSPRVHPRVNGPLAR